MARVNLAGQRATDSGLILTFTAAPVDGVKISRSSILVVRNSSAVTPTPPVCTVTIETPGTISGLAVADRMVAVAAGTQVYIDVSAKVYNNPNNLVFVDFSEIADVYVACLLK